MSEWQPIETAKPGTYLLYFPPITGRNACPSMYKVDHHPVYYPRKPTHFMVIPAPPAVAREEER